MGNVITVEDEGPGIPKKIRKTVFDRFSQNNNDESPSENQGMGLGLFMAQSFARTQDGDVLILNETSGCKIQMTLKNKPSTL
jgi:signal transduction histidine kinase